MSLSVSRFQSYSHSPVCKRSLGGKAGEEGDRDVDRVGEAGRKEGRMNGGSRAG